MKRFCQNFAVTIVALLLFFLLGEAVVRGLFRVVPNYDFEMWRYAAELKQPLPSAGLPFHHWAKKAGNYYGAEIRTNALGMREREFTPEKPAGRKRVVLLGDSYTLGWGVPYESTISRQLEQLLNKGNSDAEVVNMGVGNYNSTMEVELFKLKGVALNPDLVVLMYYINDVEPVPSLGSLKYWFQKHSYLIGYMCTKTRQLGMMREGSDWLSSYYQKIYAAGSPGLRANCNSLKELATLCRSRNIKLLVVSIPDLRRLENYPFTYATEFIRSIAIENQVPFLDLLPVFGKFPGKTLWVTGEDSHTNKKGNELASRAIYDKIRSEALLYAR